MPDASEVMNQRSKATIEVSRGTWLITSPGWHPVWSQYVMSILSLEDHPDLPPATFTLTDATHEVIVYAISPDFKLDVKKVQKYAETGGIPMLTPINIAHQFICTDIEIQNVAWYACRAIVYGQLNPETGDAPALIRREWLQAFTKSLAHLRGEEHEE
jgi:hypothetical protein